MPHGPRGSSRQRSSAKRGALSSAHALLRVGGRRARVRGLAAPSFGSARLIELFFSNFSKQKNRKTPWGRFVQTRKIERLSPTSLLPIAAPT